MTHSVFISDALLAEHLQQKKKVILGKVSDGNKVVRNEVFGQYDGYL